MIDALVVGHPAQGGALLGQLELARLQDLGSLRIVHHGLTRTE